MLLLQLFSLELSQQISVWINIANIQTISDYNSVIALGVLIEALRLDHQQKAAAVYVPCKTGAIDIFYDCFLY